MRKKRAKIYASRLHLAITLLVVVAPFVFFFVFSRVAKVAGDKLFFDIVTSFLRLLVAYGISVVLGWFCAVLFYKGKRAMIALPLFDVLQSFPTFAALPLATFLWGVSDITIIVFLVLTIVWPIFFSIVSSLKLIKNEWEEAVEISGLHGIDYFRNFLWPVSVPGLITGTIIGLGEGWEALVATEIIVGIKNGLGSFFQGFSQNASITAFGILGFLILIFSINKLLWLPLLERSHEELEE